MNTQIFDSKDAMGAAAAQTGVERLSQILKDQRSSIIAGRRLRTEMLSSWLPRIALAIGNRISFGRIY